jgi:hypothetical protein
VDFKRVLIEDEKIAAKVRDLEEEIGNFAITFAMPGLPEF